MAKWFLAGILIYSDFETVLNLENVFGKNLVTFKSNFVTSDEIIFENDHFQSKTRNHKPDMFFFLKITFFFVQEMLV